MNNIRKLRLMRKMTQQELANEINLERTSVSKYEKYDVLPSKEVLFHLADFFHVSLDFLLGRSSCNEGDAHTAEERKLLSLYATAVPQGQKAALMVLELGQNPPVLSSEEKGALENGKTDGGERVCAHQHDDEQSEGRTSE